MVAVKENTQRNGDHIKANSKNGMTHLQASECQGLPGTTEVRRAGHGTDSPPGLPQSNLLTLISDI